MVKKALKKYPLKWIITVENIIRYFNLSDKIDNPSGFKKFAVDTIRSQYKEWWAKSLTDLDNGRLNFYRNIKHKFLEENYLQLPHFGQRRVIAKFKGSDHQLAIEKGRHKKSEKIPHERRLCRLCNKKSIETEEHFLAECTFYDQLK